MSLTAAELAALTHTEPALAGDIVVTRTPGAFSLTVDGQEFPWLVTDLSTHVDPNGFPTLHLTLPANRVRVDNHVPTGEPTGE